MDFLDDSSLLLRLRKAFWFTCSFLILCLSFCSSEKDLALPVHSFACFYWNRWHRTSRNRTLASIEKRHESRVNQPTATIQTYSLNLISFFSFFFCFHLPNHRNAFKQTVNSPQSDDKRERTILLTISKISVILNRLHARLELCYWNYPL